MDDGTHDDTTNQPISLHNETTPFAAVFAGDTPAPTAISPVAGAVAGTVAGAVAGAITSIIVPDYHGVGLVDTLGCKSGRRNPFLLSLHPGGRG